MILYPPFLKRGITIAPWLVLIPRWAKGNKAYLAHEMTHVAQQRYEGVFTFWYWYLTKKQHRQAYEIEAFVAQMEAGGSVTQCAIDLSSGYDLGITYSEALSLLHREGQEFEEVMRHY